MSTNTSQGQGQGLAQVINTSRAYNEFIKGQEDAVQRGLTEKGQRDKKKDDIFKGISDVAAAETFWGHSPYFAKKQAELRNFVQDNVTEMLDGSDDAMNLRLEAEKRAAQLRTEAEYSMQIKGEVEKIYETIVKSSDDEIDRDASMAKFQEYIKSLEDGVFELPYEEIIVPKIEKINLVEYYDKNIANKLERAKDEIGSKMEDEEGVTESTLYKGVSDKRAKEIVLGTLIDPVLSAQIQTEFEALPSEEKLSYGDYKEYYFDKVKPFLPGFKKTTSTTREGDGGGLEFNFNTSGANNTKYKIDFKTLDLDKKVKITPEKTFGIETVTAELNDVKNKSDLSPLDVDYSDNRSVKATPIEAVQRAGEWFVKFSMAETDEDDDEIKKGKIFIKPWEKVSQEIIGKYNMDIPKLYEDWKGQTEEVPSYEDLN